MVTTLISERPQTNKTKKKEEKGTSERAGKPEKTNFTPEVVRRRPIYSVETNLDGGFGQLGCLEWTGAREPSLDPSGPTCT